MPTRAIKAIFFTRFHHEKGSRVLHQVPEGSITPSSSPSALTTPLLDFDSIATYLIPTQQFCDRLLTFCTNHFRVIGYPVCIREGKYSRNEFIFNFAVVIEECVADWVAYGEVVRKLGRLLRGLEEQGGFVSREELFGWEDDASGFGLGPGGVGASKVYALCEMVLEDLNNYAECMIPIDDSNTINLKLFPTRPPPPPIHPHQVPILTISLSTLTSPISSDLTLTRILPYINGINSVSHIAQLADTDLSLTRKAIQHLVYYGCLVLLDIFSFGAVYAPTAEIGGFISDASLQEECARYVRTPHWNPSPEHRPRDDKPSISSSTTLRPDTLPPPTTTTTTTDLSLSIPPHAPPLISPESLITLYTALHQGLPLRTWVLENLDHLHGIDIRRLITFGIIKGILYRVHKYAISTGTAAAVLPPAPPTSLQSSALASPTHKRDSDQATIRGVHASAAQSHALHKASVGGLAGGLVGRLVGRGEDIARLDGLVSEERGGGAGGLPLVQFLDGMHSFDEICVELEMSEKAVEGKVRGAGECQIICR